MSDDKKQKDGFICDCAGLLDNTGVLLVQWYDDYDNKEINTHGARLLQTIIKDSLKQIYESRDGKLDAVETNTFIYLRTISSMLDKMIDEYENKKQNLQHLSNAIFDANNLMKTLTSL